MAFACLVVLLICCGFSGKQNQFFTVVGSDGKEVELTPGGKATKVDFDNRKTWADLAMEYRLHEFDRQVRVLLCTHWAARRHCNTRRHRLTRLPRACMCVYVCVCRLQIAAIRRGIITIIPERALKLCTWQQLELYVCGDPRINVDLLMSHTTYHGFSGASDSTCKRFWRVMRSMTDKERSKFVRFAWGR